jgi:lipopolysaccharide transport system ATP-binding protein
MASVSNLCTKGILLENGQIACVGGVDDVIERYIDTQFREESKIIDYIKWMSPILRIDSISINGSCYSTITIPSSCNAIDVRVEGELKEDCSMNLSIRFKTKANVAVASYSMAEYTGVCDRYSKGRFVIHKQIKLPDIIYSGIYNVDIILLQPSVANYARICDCAELTFIGRTSVNGTIRRAKDYGFMGLTDL